MRKVVLIGTGSVGSAYAYSVINQGVVTELVLIDLDEPRAEGEAMDLLHGMPFAPINITVRKGSYTDCADADLVVITAGANQKPGETRLQLADLNASIMRNITRQVIDNGFNGLFLVATNPVDILTHVVQKESGFPSHKVIGSGTTLDTARFRLMLSQYFDIDSRNVHALIIGEHGDSSLPVWSQASIGIESLNKVLKRRNNPADQKNLDRIFTEARDAAYEIIQRKGVTNYGVGMCLTRITKAIFNNENSMLSVSCMLNGEYGEKDIYLSVPALIHRGGIKEVLEVELNETEKVQLAHSAQTLRNISMNLGLH